MGQARDASPQGLGSAPCPSPQISDGQVRSGLPSWELPQGKTALGSGAQDSPLPPPPVTEAAGEHEHLLLHPGAVVRGLAVPDSSCVWSPHSWHRPVPQHLARGWQQRGGPSTKDDGTSSSLARLSVPPRISRELAHLFGSALAVPLVSNTLPTGRPHHCSSKPAPPSRPSQVLPHL